MDFRFKSNLLLPALTIALGCTLFGSRAAPAVSTMLPPELSASGYLQVGEEAIRVPVENSRDYFWVGERVPLIQKNLEFFVGLMESDHGEAQIFAVPRITWDGQGTAWVTEQDELVFGVPSYTVRGSFYLRPGEWLTVLDEDEDSYFALCSRYGKEFPIVLRKNTDGLAFVADLPGNMEERVIRLHGQSGMMARTPAVINDDYLRELHAPAAVRAAPPPLVLAQPARAVPAQPFVRPAPPVAPQPAPAVETPPAVVETARAADPAPPPPAQVAAPAPVEPAPPARSPAEARKNPKWLISNTSWAQAERDDHTQVITPDNVHLALELDQQEPEPEGVSGSPGGATAETVQPEGFAAEVPSPPAPEPAVETVADVPAMATAFAQPDTTNPEPESAPDADAPALALTGTEDAPAGEVGLVAAETGPPIAQAEESMMTVAVKIVLFLVAILAAAVALVMGLAWVLNRRRTRDEPAAGAAATAEQGEPRVEQTAPATPPAAPPPIPALEDTTPAGMKEEFRKKISFNGGVFTGSLDGLTVSQLIQFLHSVEESGALSVTHGKGQRAGKIIFNRGEIIDAQCEDARGEDALREIVPFQDGIFAFARQSVSNITPTVSQGTMALLMNVLKEVDEAGEEPATAETAAGSLG